MSRTALMLNTVRRREQAVTLTKTHRLFAEVPWPKDTSGQVPMRPCAVVTIQPNRGIVTVQTLDTKSELDLSGAQLVACNFYAEER